MPVVRDLFQHFHSKDIDAESCQPMIWLTWVLDPWNWLHRVVKTTSERAWNRVGASSAQLFLYTLFLHGSYRGFWESLAPTEGWSVGWVVAGGRESWCSFIHSISSSTNIYGSFSKHSSCFSVLLDMQKTSTLMSFLFQWETEIHKQHLHADCVVSEWWMLWSNGKDSESIESDEMCNSRQVFRHLWWRHCQTENRIK